MVENYWYDYKVSYFTHKLCINLKLLYNEENIFCTKIDLLSFKITLSLAKLDMVGSRLISNGLIFLGDTLFDIQ